MEVIEQLVQSITQLFNPQQEAVQQPGFEDFLNESITNGDFDVSLSEATDKEVDEIIKTLGKERGFTDEEIEENLVNNPPLTKPTVLLKWGLAKAFIKPQGL